MSSGLRWKIVRQRPPLAGSKGSVRLLWRLIPTTIALFGFLLAVPAVKVSASAATTSEWTITPSSDAGGQNLQLDGVSCTGKASCVAVGQYAKLGFSSLQTLVEVWNGLTWSVVPSPSPGSFANYLFGVSCTSRNFCIAVGFRADNAITTNVL